MKITDSYFLYCLAVLLCSVFRQTFCLDIQNNAYYGIGVSISDHIQIENSQFQKFQKVLQHSSEILYHATRRRAYFGEFILVLPSTVNLNDNICYDTTDPPETIDVFLTRKADLRTQHSRGCGSEGDLILMTVEWLNGDIDVLAHQLVKEWATYRYGVFDETAIEESCEMLAQNLWISGGCYNLKVPLEINFQENGVPRCTISDDFLENGNLTSSLMAFKNTSKMIDFCDGSKAFPHNPASSTLHNNICEGRTVWSVIENSNDFKYGRNFPRKEATAPVMPVFKCHRLQSPQLVIAIQIEGTKNLFQGTVDLVLELRYSIFHFLKNIIPKETKVNLVAFSDESYSDASVDLDLSNEANLKKELENLIKQNDVVSSVCLSCGLQRAFNASKSHNSAHRTVILLAWKSALKEEKTSNIVSNIRSFDRTPLHLVLVEDVTEDLVRSALVEAIRSTGGFLYLLPLNISSMLSELNGIFANVVNLKPQIERKIFVVHESSYVMDKEIAFNDSFSIPSGSVGSLMYIMHCFPKKVEQSDVTCKNWDVDFSDIMKCGEVQQISDKNNPAQSFTYTFNNPGGIYKPICNSIALLNVPLGNSYLFSLRGWFSDYVVQLARNDLIIYAEILESTDSNFQVEAVISGPGFTDPFRIKLHDNGNGDPDIIKGDGIYSRYFTSFKKKGTYEVTLSAETIENTSASESSSLTSSMKYVQKVNIGAFTVAEDPPLIDILPPNRVGDLRVQSIDHDNRVVTLQWTAPGNDYDFGEATRYDVFCTEDWKDLQNFMLSKIQLRTLKAIEKFTPKTSGDVELVSFQIPPNSNTAVYYIALRALDFNNNCGNLSNIVQAFLSYDNDQLRNISKINITIDDNVTTTEHEINEAWNIPRLYIVSISVVGGLLIAILIINIMLWIICWKRRRSSVTKEKLDDESVMNQKLTKELQDIKEKGTSDHSFTNRALKTDAVLMDENDHSRNTLHVSSLHPDASLYAHVQKEKKNEILRPPLQNFGTSYLNLKHKEKDLGCV